MPDSVPMRMALNTLSNREEEAELHLQTPFVFDFVLSPRAVKLFNFVTCFSALLIINTDM